MNTILRTCLLLAVTLGASSGFAATFKIATLSPEGSYWMEQMRDAAKAIQEETDQRVKFRFYPGGVMGNDDAVLRKIRIGQLQGAALSGGALANRAPDTQVYNLPLLFNNYDEVDHVRKQMDSLMEQKFADAGFISFGLAEGGFAYIMSKERIASTGDLTRQKVWAPGDDPVAQAAAETFDFTPTPLAIGDVLTGLQTDLINTVTTSPVAAIALQWHSQVNYITDIPLAYIYALLAIDKRAYNRLSDADKTVVDKNMRAAFTRIDRQNRKDNKAAKKALQDQGITLVTPDAEQLNDWYAKTRMATEQFIKKSGIDAAILERAQQLLKTYRSQQANAE